MAEAVGLTASIAGLANLALNIFSALYRYGTDLKGAPAQSEQLRKEMSELQTICKIVEGSVKITAKGLPEALEGQINEFKETLETMLKRATQGTTSGLRKLKWPFDKAENAEYIAKIERIKSTLHLIMNADQTPLLYDMKQALSYVKDDTQEIKQLTTQIRNVQIDDDLKDFLEKLCPQSVNPADSQERNMSTLTKNTGKWIFESEQYNSWLKSPRSFLWLQGKMGAGKTILTSSVIDSLMCKVRTEEEGVDKGLAYFYCDGNSQHLASDSTIVFRCLLRQLVSQYFSQRNQPSVIAAMKTRFSESPKVTNDFVLSFLNWISEYFSEVFLVIDGVDECSDYEEFCESLARLVESPTIKVFVASRPEHGIATANVFVAKPVLNIDDKVKCDISTHLSHYIENDRKLKRLRPELKCELLNTISAKCGGMYALTYGGLLMAFRFRWVQCHLDHLRTLRTEIDVKDALDKLPPGLPATYTAMLERIGRNPRDLKYARRAFMWLLHSPRALALKELAVAAVLDPESEFEDAMRLTSCDDVLEICSSFVKLGAGTTIVEFAHFSVTEFLTSAMLPNGAPNEHYVDQESANVLILKACFSYLRSSAYRSLSPYFLSQKQRDWLKTDDFYLYASLTWSQLVRKYPDDHNRAQLIYQFLQSNSFSGWSSIWSHDWLSVTFNDTDLRLPIRGCVLPPTPLYVATEFDLPILVRMILENEGSPNQEGGRHSYPIFMAIMNRSVPVLTLLLRAGADVNVRMGDGSTPLHYAVTTINLPIVRLLAEWKADVTAKNADGLTPLMIGLSWIEAIAPGTVLSPPNYEAAFNMIRLLSNDGNEVKVLAEALSRAINHNYPNTAKLLLNNDPSLLNLQDFAGNTLLHLTVLNLQLADLASILLEGGADDTIRNRGGLRAIDLAAKAENVPMLRTLGKIRFEQEPMDYSLDDIDLAVLLDTPGYNDIRTYVELFMYLSSLDPTEHSWYCHLARACFKLGEHTIAARLWERSYQLNPQNEQVTLIEGLAQSIQCERCEEPIYGRQWICMKCYKQLCEPCHRFERALYHDCDNSKRHYFIGFPAYSCQLRAERWIESSPNRHREIYELLEESLNPESYYVCDYPH